MPSITAEASQENTLRPLKHSNLVLLVVTIAAIGLLIFAGANPRFLSLSQGATPPDTSSPAVQSYRDLPAWFAPNEGQFDKRVKYFGNSGSATLFFSNTAVTYLFTKESDEPAAGKQGSGSAYSVKIGFAGANPEASISGRAQQEGTVNFMTGADPKDWQSDLPTFSGITYNNLYDGIDLGYAAEGSKIKYTFQVAPGADLNQIMMRYQGVDALGADSAGNLVINTPWGRFEDKKPVAYQEKNGRRVPIAAAFVVTGKTVSFDIGRHDRGLPLMIDPGLEYSTLIHNSTYFPYKSVKMAVDNQGNAFVAGYTRSSDFPVEPALNEPGEVVGPKFFGDKDAFIAKFNPSGTDLVYATYIGGQKFDAIQDIVVDGDGMAFVTGYTDSTDFPTTPDVYGGSLNAGPSGYSPFVATLNSSGTAFGYSTYLGSGTGNAIAVDGQGSVFVGGKTESSAFPVTAGAFQTVYTGRHQITNFAVTFATGFVSKLKSDGSDLIYSTYYGGSNPDSVEGIEIDGSGRAFITGYTESKEFPTTSNAFDRTINSNSYQDENGITLYRRDVFVAKLNGTGSAPIWSTFLGGRADEIGEEIDVDASGNAYVVGSTKSEDFQTTSWGFDPGHDSDWDVFVAKIAASGAQLSLSTVFGGYELDKGKDIVIDSERNMLIVGYTKSSDFPTTPNGFDRNHGGAPRDEDGFLINLSSTGRHLNYSTFLGGTRRDCALGVAIDSAQGVYAGGRTTSLNYPVSIGAFDTSNEYMSVFVTKLDLPPAAAIRIAGGARRTRKRSLMLNASGAAYSGRTVTKMRFKDGGGSWTSWEPYKKTKAWVLPAGNGDKAVYIQVRDSAGNVSVQAVDTIFFDNRPPSVSLKAPTLSSNISKSKRFRISWRGTDPTPGSGFIFYRVISRKDTNRGWSTLIKKTRKRSRQFEGKAGRTYYFRVRAEDAAGNVGWSAIKKTIVPYNQGSHVRRRRGFSRFYASATSQFYLNSVKFSRRRGDMIEYKFKGKRVSLISTKGPSRGRAKIFIDGRRIRTIDTRASKFKARRAVFTWRWSRTGTHYLKIVNSGTPGRRRFDVDGLAVGR